MSLGQINEVLDALAYLRDDIEQWKKIDNQLNNVDARSHYMFLLNVQESLKRRLLELS